MASLSSRDERIFAIGMTVVSISLLIRSFTYPVASSVFPRFLSIVLLILSALLVIKVIRGPRQVEGVTISKAQKFSLTAMIRSPSLFVFASVSLYVLAMEVLGFLTSSMLFMFGCMCYLRNRSWIVTVFWSLGFPILVYLIFHSLLGLQLPRGWLM